MCLYPKLIENKRYKPSIKNGGIVPICDDERKRYIPAKCGKCFECRQEKAREWQVRICEELKVSFGYFVTLTFSDESLNKLCEQTGLKGWKGNENNIATAATRLFLERIRKELGTSIKHWFVTELGEEKDRIHLHGILFDQRAVEYMRKHWNYGITYVGDYCNLRTVRYIVKYMTKKDVKHPDFCGKVLCSKGIGEAYLKRINIKEKRKRAHIDSVPQYIFPDGKKCKLPKYYVEKIFKDEEREEMWMRVLDEGITYIHGEKVSMDDEETIDNLRRYYRDYGIATMFDNEEAWEMEKERKKLERWKRIRALTGKKKERYWKQKQIQDEKRAMALRKFSTLQSRPLKAEFTMVERELKKQEYERKMNKILGLDWTGQDQDRSSGYRELVF